MKKIMMFVAAILILMGFAMSGYQVEAADTVIYDAADFEVFQNRTKEEIGKKYGEALYAGDSYVNYAADSYYETIYSLKEPYAAGKLTEDTHKTMTAMTDFYRWLVGVEPLLAVSEHSDKLQAEALIRNFEFNHSVSDASKPEDMSQEIWDYGAKNSIHTILARYSTPRNAITSWMNEGYILSVGRWDTVGHRYALIGAEVSDVQYGYAGIIAAGQEKAYDNTMNIPFSAFPAPGYMPSDLVRSSSSAWSIEINRQQLSITDSSNIVVRVTSLSTSETYECTVKNNKLSVSGSVLAFVQPALTSGKIYTGSYRVEVTGLTNAATGQEAVLTYTTEFFDPTEYTPSYVKTVTADGIEKYILYREMATTENLNKIAYALPSEVTVITENGRKAQIPVKGRWILDEKGQCWINQADAAKLPEDITDREHVLENCAIFYEISDSIYDSYNYLSILPSAPNKGDAGYMSVYLTYISADTSAIFQLIPQEDGTYIGKKKYDSRTSAEFDRKASEDYHVYKISSFQMSDAGEYFSIFYDSSDTCAYVSTAIRSLTVSDPAQSDDNITGTEGNVPKVAKIKSFKITAKKKAFVLTWKKNSQVSGYEIQISTKKNLKGAKKFIIKKDKNKYKISKLKSNKKYYVRIRAYKSYKTQDGKTKKAYGKWTLKNSKTK